MNSCVYEGVVRHRRMRPVAHEFRHPLFQLFLDLAELPEVFDRFWLWSARRPAPAWFRRADYLGDAATPLDASVRALVAQRTGRAPLGPIRMLTHLRYWGYVQNPVTFYYCYRPGGETLDTIVAEITNTPWGERYAYVVPASDEGKHRREMPKVFHVSPLLPMQMTYDWRFATPGEHLAVHMENLVDGERVFDATLTMERRPLTSAVLAGCLARHPFMTARVVTAIYWQALRLRLKGAAFHPHKDSRRPDGIVLPAR